MALFICCLCDQAGDSDDGCEEFNGKHCHPECKEQYDSENKPVSINQMED